MLAGHTYEAAVALGLSAAFGFGLGDLCARTAAHRMGSLRAMFYGGLQGLVIVSLWLLWRGQWPAASATAWTAAIGAGLLNLAATTALFRAFTTGKLALVAPVVASYGAVTVVLSLATGQSLSPLKVAGLVLAIGGVALTSSGSRGKQTAEEAAAGRGKGWHLQAGLGWALLAAAGYGTTFWILGRFAVPELGELLPVWIYYVAETIILLVVAAFWRITVKRPAADEILPTLGNGVLIAAGYVSFTAGLTSGEIAIVTVLSSLSSGVTVLGAALFLRERMARRQWVGTATILVGLVLINSGR